MSRFIAYILLFLMGCQYVSSQEDGVVALELPIRNSLRFNRYAINPTFSFVREQNKYISFTNKRQWVQFDDAPQTYLFSYSGRFGENIGAGIGVFQQDYGVLTTFGGLVNFAYNVVMNRDSNLTFGTNLGFYSSGINDGRVIANFPDSSLDNIPSNAILTINPGFNYGTSFFDFGISVNNLVAYNLSTSEMLQENPQQAIQGHIMYTGYMNSRGFFDQSKFSTLLRSEFKKDQTVISGIAMITVPKGIWAQAGYNTVYGASAGIGLNITKEIAIEYNYEQALGDFSNFGNSHEITLAYKFQKKYRYNYGDDDDEQALLMPSKKSKRVLASSVPASKKNLERVKREPRVPSKPVALQAEAKDTLNVVTNTPKVEIPEKTEEELIEEQRLKAIEIAAKKRKQEQEKAEAEAKAQEELAKRQAEAARLKAEADAKTKREEAARIKAEQERKEKLEIEAKLKAEQARLAEEAKRKAEQEEQARLEEQSRIKAEQEEQARLAEEAKIKAEAEERARLAEEAKLKAEAEEQARLEAEAQQKETERKAQLSIEAEDIIPMIDLNGVMVPVPRDNKTREMNGLTALTVNSKIEQENLLQQLRERIAVKQQDLDALKKENDLSEQGIVSAPRAFKSISAENALMKQVQSDLDNIIKARDLNIKELEALYNERLKTVRDKNEDTNQYYLNKIQELKSEQTEANQLRAQLMANLERIDVATEVERKRRIKRAAYDNEQARYQKDRNALTLIRETTPLSETALTSDQFDSGDVSSNIQIVKGVTNVENGYYLVVAVHSDVAKRDEFLRKAVAAGEQNIDFFFDVNSNKYYIYYQKFDMLDAAARNLSSKGSKPYNTNMSMVKVEN